MKLRKSGRTEVRLIEKEQSDASKNGGGQVNPQVEEIEGELWEDLDGNVYAWTPKGSGVISIEVKGGDDESPETDYRKFQWERWQPKSLDERVFNLEQMVTKILKYLHDLKH